MNLEWLQKNVIYLTIHGSRAYGMATDMSDLDVKGIVVPPREVEYNLFDRFEQSENCSGINSLAEKFKNPLNPKIESVVYSLRKFFILASEVNPNIVELLWTDKFDQIIITPIMENLIDQRSLFLSNKARWTWSGYAFAQAKKIDRHRQWIVKGKLCPPTREKFGLPPKTPPGVSQIFDYIKSKVEEWNLSKFPIDEMSRAELKETIWELVYSLSHKQVSWDNWPDAYAQGVMLKIENEFDLSENAIRLINAERAYAKEKSTYESWLHWKEERNPARKILEEKCGFDCKHASQLIRLMRMGYEILTTGNVIVKRPDADELLAIKNGAWTYEKVMEYKNEIESKLEAEYTRQKQLLADGKPTPLPREVDKVRLNEFYHELYERYWMDWN